MKYRLHKNKNLGSQIVLLLRDQVSKACRFLEQYETQPAESVHGARQTFKRCRSLVHLVRDAHPYTFAVENRSFRNMGRALGPARDHVSMGEAMGRLTNLPMTPHAAATRPLRAWFNARQSGAPATPVEDRMAVYAVLKSLEAAEKRLGVLELPKFSHRQLLDRLQLTRLEFGRHYREACLQESPVAYHDWRKKTKRLHDQLRLCQAFDPDASSESRRIIKRVADALGRHQDIVLLHDSFVANPGGMDSVDLAQVMGLLDDWMKSERLVAKEQMPLLRGADKPQPKAEDAAASAQEDDVIQVRVPARPRVLHPENNRPAQKPANGPRSVTRD
jgi:CHAD domain-containing protein